MALRLDNTAEGTSGNAVPATTIGAPNAFNASSKSGTGTTTTFDNAQAHQGSTSIKHAIAAVASTSYVEWFATISPASANMYVRLYIYMTARPTNTVATAVTRLIGLLSTSTAGPALVLNSTGASSNPGCIRINNSSGSAAATATTQIPINQWVRIEWDVTSMTATTANSACRVFSGANLEGATPDYTISATAMTNSAATMNRVRFGPGASVTLSSAWNLWNDDMAYSDTVSPGSAITTTTVGSNRVSTWATLGTIVSTRASTWAALASVTSSRASTWAALTPVVSTRVSTWVTVASVLSSRASIWAVLAPIITTRAGAWNVAATGQVSSSRSSTWTTSTTVPATRASTWVTRSAIASSRSATWAVAAQIIATRPSTWVTRASVVATRVSTWNVSAPVVTVVSTRASTWNVAAAAVGIAVVADMQPGAGANPPPTVVASRVVAWAPTLLILPGDLANDGTTAQYGFYNTMYGSLKAKSKPVPGNHDWGNTAGNSLAAYKTYWSGESNASNTDGGWYSFDLQVGTTTWHIIGVDSDNNSNASALSPTTTTLASGSTVYNAIAADLAANVGKPIIAFMHHPRWSDGTATGAGGTFDDTSLTDLWNLLYDYHADLVLAGHCHSYQRFPKFSKTGTADANGIREIVVGTGGSGLHTLASSGRRSTVSSYQAAAYDQLNSQWFGYLRLTLTPTTYTWAFISQDGTTTLDSGTDTSNVVGTTVGSSRGSTWNVRETVPATRASTWNVATPVTGSSATTWNVLTTATSSRATTWNTKAAIASQRATSWHVQAQTTSSRATTWNVLIITLFPESTPPERTFMVEADSRTDDVMVETRTATVTPEDRTTAIPPESRSVSA